MAHISEEEMVQRALEMVKGLGPRPAGRRLGVSETTIRRWRDEGPSFPLRSNTREPLERIFAAPERAVREPRISYQEDTPIAKALTPLPELEKHLATRPRSQRLRTLQGWAEMTEGLGGVLPRRYYELLDEIKRTDPPTSE